MLRGEADIADLAGAFVAEARRRGADGEVILSAVQQAIGSGAAAARGAG